LYQDNGAWYVRYRERVRQKDGSTNFRRRAKRLGSVDRFPRSDDIEPPRVSFMQRINHDRCDPDSSATLAEFVDRSYLLWAEQERRASTSKGYREIWENHISARLGESRVRDVCTVHVSRMLRAIAAEHDFGEKHASAHQIGAERHLHIRQERGRVRRRESGSGCFASQQGTRRKKPSLTI
jgi:hypothetical protein